MTTREERIAWMRSLKVGDMVCDCRYKHLRIKEIYEDVDDDGTLYDKDLILEDGASCSALNCCDPADHEWNHPADHEWNHEDT